MSNIAQVQIVGSCTLTWKGIDMGHTLGGVSLKVNRTFKPVLVDQYGSMPIDQVLTGEDCQIIFTLAEDSWNSQNVALPETSSYDGGTNALRRTDLGADAGYSLRNNDAGLLVIHPRKNAAGDFSQDINFYRAASTQAVQLDYKIDAQAVIQVTMEALVDEAYSSGRRLGHIGTAAVS